VGLDPGIAAMVFKAAMRDLSGATYAGAQFGIGDRGIAANSAYLPVYEKYEQNDENAATFPVTTCLMANLR
jgi:hypothetical protein